MDAFELLVGSYTYFSMVTVQYLCSSAGTLGRAATAADSKVFHHSQLSDLANSV
jgi:hypothetical protein